MSGEEALRHVAIYQGEARDGYEGRPWLPRERVMSVLARYGSAGAAARTVRRLVREEVLEVRDGAAGLEYRWRTVC